mmetsp:Transcript_124210/g.397558  ORF Transcript_124210/g.397558 Transcript_124210/m.397558 type:complete len:577 (-) Transcript_124210:535-2265(-)
MELPPFFTDPDADGRHAFTFSNGSEPDYDCDVSFGLEALDGKCRSISEPCGPFTRATAENTTSADAPGHAMNSNQFESKSPTFSTDTDDGHAFTFGKSCAALVSPHDDTPGVDSDSESDSDTTICEEALDSCFSFTIETAKQKAPTDTLGHAMNTNQFENTRNGFLANPVLPSHTDEGPKIRVGSRMLPARLAVNTGSVSTSVTGPESSSKNSQQQEQVYSPTGPSQSYAPTLAKRKVWDSVPVRPAGAPTMRSPAKRGPNVLCIVVQPRCAATESGSVPSGSAAGIGRLGVEPTCAGPQLDLVPQCVAQKFRAVASNVSKPSRVAAKLGSAPRCTTSARFGCEPPGVVGGIQPPASCPCSPPSPVGGSSMAAMQEPLPRRSYCRYAGTPPSPKLSARGAIGGGSHVSDLLGDLCWLSTATSLGIGIDSSINSSSPYAGTPPSPPLHARGTIGGGGHVSDPVGDLCRLSTATNLSIGIDSSSSSNSNSSGKEHQKQTSPRLAVDIIQAIREKLGGGRCGGPVADFGAEDIQERRMTYKPPRVEGRRRKPASVEVEERATYRPPRMTLDVRDVVLKL